MKTLKIMSIIALCVAGISVVCLVAWNNPIDYEAGIGWGIIASLYLIAFGIVALLHSTKNNKPPQQ